MQFIYKREDYTTKIIRLAIDYIITLTIASPKQIGLKLNGIFYTHVRNSTECIKRNTLY